MDTRKFNNKLISLGERLSYLAISYTANQEDAKDLLQDTFLKALNSKERFQEDTNLLAWATTIMRNTYINLYRRKGLTQKAFDTNVIDIEFTDNYRNINHCTSLYSEVKETLRILESLDDDFRVPFHMYIDGYKYREIARRLNLNIGTVKSRIFTARKRLIDIAAS